MISTPNGLLQNLIDVCKWWGGLDKRCDLNVQQWQIQSNLCWLQDALYNSHNHLEIYQTQLISYII